MTTRLYAIVLLAISIMTTALGGCASTADSPTDGYSLTFRQSHVQTSQFIAYRLTTEGRLVYSAGRAAFVNEDASARPTWADRFTRDELRPLVDLLENAAEIEATPITEGGPELQLVIGRPGSIFAPVLKTGPQPQVQAIAAELNRLQRGRRGDELVPAEVVPKY